MKYAFVSLTNRDGAVQFISELIDKHQYKVIATDGTLAYLKRYRSDVIPFSSIFIKPLLNQLIKTIDHRFYMSIFSDIENKEDMENLERLKIPKISLYVVNLYDLDEESISNNDMSSMDIGGVSIIRAAAKNYKNNLIVSDPNDYNEILNRVGKSTLDISFRKRYAAKAVAYTSQYDKRLGAIIAGKTIEKVKYGENPHSTVTSLLNYSSDIARLRSARNRPLSLNNLCDLDIAMSMMSTLYKQRKTKVAIFIKHGMPAAVACSDSSIEDAVKTAYSSDPTSIFGGVLVINDSFNKSLLDFLKDTFLEVIAGYDYEDAVDTLLDKRKRLRAVTFSSEIADKKPVKIFNTRFGMFVQRDPDYDIEFKLVTSTSNPASVDLHNDMAMAWNIVRYVRSNAIVILSNSFTVGIGSGRVSRVEAAKDAISMYTQNRRNFTRDVDRVIVASDGFFPFEDSIDLLSQIEASCIVQPGGSIRDSKVIEACNSHGISMYFTGKRAFYH